MLTMLHTVSNADFSVPNVNLELALTLVSQLNRAREEHGKLGAPKM